MKSRSTYSVFCGIDIGKHKHIACIADRDGQYVLKSHGFNNDLPGYQRLLNHLSKAAKAENALIGMEATGHYWYSIHDFLGRHGYRVVVLNPIQTSQQARRAIRKCKTDKHDARHIATLIRSGQYKDSIIPTELGMTCRQLSRLRHSIVGQCTRVKQLVRARLHPIWPEYEAAFGNMFCRTSIKLLHTAPTPADVLAMDAQELMDLVCKTSRGQCGPEQVRKICRAARDSVGMKRGIIGTRTSIRILLDQLQATEAVLGDLEKEIKDLAEQLPRYLLSIPGAFPILAVSLFGETDPIDAFSSSSQLVAFAGLDPTVYQTGQFNATRRHISKRGNPFLRRTIWDMAHRAVYQKGDLREFWLRKRRQQMHYLAAVTAAANKLCHVIWRILTDRRDYVPEGYEHLS